MVVCLEQGADLHIAQLMPLPLTVSCFSKIQIGFTFLVPAHLGSRSQRAFKWVCVCVSFFIPVRSFFINFCSFVVFLAFDLHLHFAYAVLSIICYFVTVDLSRGNVLSSELQSPISTQSVYALSVSGWKMSVTTVV